MAFATPVSAACQVVSLHADSTALGQRACVAACVSECLMPVRRPLSMHNDKLLGLEQVRAGRQQPGHVHHEVGGQHPLHAAMHHISQPASPWRPVTHSIPGIIHGCTSSLSCVVMMPA